MPTRLILKKLISIMLGALKWFALFLSALIFVLWGVPLATIIVLRVCLWAIEGSLPQPTFLRSLLFGKAFDNASEALSGLVKADITEWLVRVAFRFAFVQGLFTLLPTALVVVLLIFTREMVIRDDGFERLVRKKFGDEVQFKKRLLHELTAMIANEQERHPEDQDAGINVDELIFGNQTHLPNDHVPFEGEAPRRLNFDFRQFEDPIEDEIEEEHGHGAFPEAAEFGVPEAQLNEQAADEIDLEFLVGVTPLTPVKVALVAVPVIAGAATLLYLIPSLIGMSLTKLCSLIFSTGLSILSDSWKHLPIPDKLATWARQYLPVAWSYVPTLPSSLVFYAILLKLANLFIQKISLKKPLQRPLRGSSRLIALTVFQVLSTLKVFLLFLLELVIFPLYCGFLVDIALSPLFVHAPYPPLVLAELALALQPVVDALPYSTPEFWAIASLPIPPRVFLYWALGTTYMCLLSFFVGMTRLAILRPGVLYFIRSPDDPNARLLHDAIVRPLGFQLLRIGLSGLIYTALIVIGVGGVALAVRLSPLGLLPVNLCFKLLSFLYINPVVWKLSVESALMAKYVRSYWKRAFAHACRLLRLLSFILDLDYSDERGHKQYRSWYHWLTCRNVEPDYTKPQVPRAVPRYFKENPQENVVFVPDGTYVRAPSNESVLRKVLYRMFVPVTRNDQLLAPITARPPEDLDLDLEPETDTHAVVYRPPDFRKRVAALFVFLWGYAALLIIGLLLTALALGRPVTMLMCKFQWPGWLVKLTYGLEYPGRAADFPLMLYGVWSMLSILRYLERSRQSSEGNGGPWHAQIIPPFPELMALAKKLIFRVFIPLFGAILACLVHFTWFVFAHYICVGLAYLYFTDGEFFHSFFKGEQVPISDFFSYDREYLFSFNYRILLVHLVVSLYTVQPLVARLYSYNLVTMERGILETLSEILIFKGRSDRWKVLLYQLKGIIIATLTMKLVEAKFGTDLMGSHTEKVYFYGVLPDDGRLLKLPFVGQCTKTTMYIVLHCVGLAIGCLLQAVDVITNYLKLMNEIVKEEVYGTSRRLENFQ